MSVQSDTLADVLMGLRARMTEAQQTEVLRMQYQAIGYVWGWQDAGRDDKDTSASWQFGIAFAIHCAEYALELSAYRTNIADAYRKYRTGLTTF